MADMWITDIQDYMDDSGRIPPGIPAAAIRFATFLCAIISVATSDKRSQIEEIETTVPCRRRPGHRKCAGKLRAKIVGSRINWRCPICDDAGKISGWEETEWDQRGLADVPSPRRGSH